MLDKYDIIIQAGQSNAEGSGIGPVSETPLLTLSQVTLLANFQPLLPPERYLSSKV